MHRKHRIQLLTSTRSSTVSISDSSSLSHQRRKRRARRSLTSQEKSPMKKPLRFVCVSFFATRALVFTPAETRADTWDGSANNGGAWSTNINWADNSEPTSSDPAIFPTPIPNGDATISLSATEHAASLTFNDSYTLGANFLQLETGSITVASGKTATISSVLTGTAGISKSGAGTLSLTGANAFSGTVSINTSAGPLVIRNSGNLGNAANTISLGSTLRIQPQTV